MRKVMAKAWIDKNKFTPSGNRLSPSNIFYDLRRIGKSINHFL